MFAWRVVLLQEAVLSPSCGRCCGLGHLRLCTMLIDYEDANDFFFETKTYMDILEQRHISWNLSTAKTDLSDDIVG